MATGQYKFEAKADFTNFKREVEASASEVYKLKSQLDSTNKELAKYKKTTDESKSSVASFGGGLSSIKGALGGVVAGFASAEVAMQVFNGVLNNSQALGDAWAKTTEEMKGALDYFYRTLATGDWSNFFSNMQEAIRLAGEYAEAMDKSGDASDNFSLQNSNTELIISRSKSIISDKNSTEEEKKKAQADLDKAVKDKEKVAQHTAQRHEETAVARYREISGNPKATLEDAQRYVRENAMGFENVQEREYNRLIDKYTPISKETQMEYNEGDVGYSYSNPTKRAIEAKNFIENLNKQFPHFKAKREQYDKIADGKRKELVDDILKANSARQSYYESVTQQNKLNNRVDKVTNVPSPKVEKKKEKIDYQEGSIAHLQTQLQAYDKELNNTLVSEERLQVILQEKAKLQEKINALMETYNLISKKDKGYQDGSIADKQSQLAEINKQLTTLSLQPHEITAKLQLKENLEEEIADIQARISPKINVEAKAKVGSIGFINNEITKYEALLDMEIVGSDEWTKINEELTLLKQEKHKIELSLDKGNFSEEMEEVQNSISTVGSVFQNLGSILGEESGQFLRFVGTVAQGISQMLPEISKLIVANQAKATSGMVASASGLPFVAILPAIATGMAVISSIFSSLPKFTNGGIFTGGGSIGDLNLARVNSGEMILNTTQQSRLFALLDGKQHIQQSSNIGGNVTFKIHGSELVGVLNNHTSKRNRVI